MHKEKKQAHQQEKKKPFVHVATPITKLRHHQPPKSSEEPERLSAKKQTQIQIQTQTQTQTQCDNTKASTVCTCMTHEQPKDDHTTKEQLRQQSEQTAPASECDRPSTPPKGAQANLPRSANRSTPKRIPRTPASAKTPEQRAQVAEEKEFASVKVALNFDDEEEHVSSQNENVDNFIQKDISDEMLVKNTEEKKERLSQIKSESGANIAASDKQSTETESKVISAECQQDKDKLVADNKRKRESEDNSNYCQKKNRKG